MRSDRHDRVIFIALNALSAVGGAAVLRFTEEAIARQLHLWPELRWIFLLAALAVIAYVLVLVYDRTNELLRQQSYQLQFYPCDDTKQASRAYKALQALMEGLPEDGVTEVMVLNSFVEKFDQFEAEGERARAQYLASIERKIGKIHYHRLMQVRHEDLNGQLSERVAGNYQAHCRRILERQTELSRVRTSIEIAPSIYPLSFIIINTRDQGSTLLWQIEEHIPESEPNTHYRVAGYLFLRDPQRTIVERFERWFHKVAGQPTRRPLRVSDLSPVLAHESSTVAATS